MTAAPDHNPTFASLTLAERIAKSMPVLLIPILVVLGFLAIGSPA